jgi:hypothetical protein
MPSIFSFLPDSVERTEPVGMVVTMMGDEYRLANILFGVKGLVSIDYVMDGGYDSMNSQSFQKQYGKFGMHRW